MDAASYFLVNSGGVIFVLAVVFFALGAGLGWWLWGQIKPQLEDTQRELRITRAQTELTAKEAKQLRAEREAKQDNLAKAAEERERERLRADSAERQQGQLETQLTGLKQENSALQEQLGALEKDKAGLESRIDVYKTAVSELKAKADRAAEDQTQIADLQRRLQQTEAENTELQQALAEVERQIAAQSSAAQAPEPPEPPAADAPAPSSAMRTDPELGLVFTQAPETPDDLTRIKGVGEVLQRKLNEYGVYVFSQIAAWTPAQVEAFSSRLSFKGRIQREKWIEQAKTLADDTQDQSQ